MGGLFNTGNRIVLFRLRVVKSQHGAVLPGVIYKNLLEVQ